MLWSTAMKKQNIRDLYKNWLIEQGLKVKTAKGHTSTVTEYLRRVDRICDRIYKRHTASAWNSLATNISDVLIMCYECVNKEYFINIHNINDIIQHFKNNIKVNIPFKIKLSLICQNKEQYITLISSVDLIEYLNIFQSILNENKRKLNTLDNFVTICLMRENSDIILKDYECAINKLALPDSYFSDLILHIEYMTTYSAKDKAGLNKFYQFLSNPPVNDNTPNGLHLVKLKDSRNDDSIKICLATIENTHEHLLKFTIQKEKTGKNALQVTVHKGSNGGITAKELTNGTLKIDHKTLQKLKNEGALVPTKKATYIKDFYDENTLNDYLLKHFHPAKEFYEEVDYSQTGEDCWCNKEEAAKTLKCSVRTIYTYTKKGLLTYTDYAPQSPRYYKPELEMLQKLKKFPRHYNRSKL